MMKIWLHVGASKTGTSALQSALARNRLKLANAGLWYPEAMSAQMEQRALAAEVTSGNANELGQLINSSLRPKYFVDRASAIDWVQRALIEADGRVLLLSSEALQAPDINKGRELVELITRSGHQLQILYYVRHALDHCIASFTQWLKIGMAPHGELDLNAHVARCIIPFQHQLGVWAAVAGEGSVTCRVYDEDRPTLLRSFLETVHPPSAVDFEELIVEDAPMVNRSPTMSELRILQRLNLEFDKQKLCRWLSDSVMNTPPSVFDPLCISQAAFNAFMNNNTSQVDAINARWLLPVGRMPLKLSSDRIGIGLPHSSSIEDAFAACFISTVRKIEQQNELLQLKVDRLESELRKFTAKIQ